MIGRNDPCWCGSDKKWKKCHYPQKGTPKLLTNSLKDEYFRKYQIIIKTKEEIEKIREACKLASNILDQTCKKAAAGVTTGELNDFAHELHQKAGAIPASLNYGNPPYPGSICTSTNDVVCHGIPGEETLKDGDILNIDVACILDGYFGDCSQMVMIGEVNDESRLVVDVSHDALMKSIEILRPGISVSEIGNVIETYATEQGCSVVNQFVGHGVGIQFHEGPQVPHYRNNFNIPLQPGMTFTIEPMINAGAREAVIDKTDKWTARTVDGKPSAQWEHTILITEDGHEILTPWKRNH